MSAGFLGTILAKLLSTKDDVSAIKTDTDAYLDAKVSDRATASALATVDANVDTILSRVTAAVATASALSSHDGKLDTVDANVDTIKSRTDTTTSSRASSSALAVVDANVDTILSRVTAAVATASALSSHDGKLDTVDSNVDDIKAAQNKTSHAYCERGSVAGGDPKTEVLSVSGAGVLSYISVCDSSDEADYVDVYVKVDGGTEVKVFNFSNEQRAGRLAIWNVRYNTSLSVSVTPNGSNRLYYLIAYSKE